MGGAENICWYRVLVLYCCNFLTPANMATIAHQNPEGPTYSLPAWNTEGAGIAENDTRTSEISLFGVGGESMWEDSFSALS